MKKANIQQTLFNLQPYEPPDGERKQREKLTRLLYKKGLLVTAKPITWVHHEEVQFAIKLDAVLREYQTILNRQGKDLSILKYRPDGQKHEQDTLVIL